MAASGGHWATLAEAQKLSQSTKIPGVFEEDIKRNNPIERVPVAQAAGTGLKIEWLREDSVIDEAVAEKDIGDQLSWAEDVTYTEVEATLRYLVIQRKLDRFVQNIYGTYTDYKAQVLLEMEKGCKRKIGDRLIYGDTTYGGTPTQFDGLHALAAERGSAWAGSGANSKLNMDMGNAALSLNYIRNMVDAMKYGVNEIWMPPQLGLRFDAAYDERGFTYAVSSSENFHYSLITRGINEIGMPILYFMGIPIIRTDYLVQEDDGTGLGSDARASGTDNYSIFLVTLGNVMAREPGLTYAFGGTEALGDFYELWTWDRLEDYNAGGMRMDTYGTVLLGSTLCLGRIIDISDAAIVA